MIQENRTRGLITVAEMRRDQCLDAVACEGSAGRFAQLGCCACTRALGLSERLRVAVWLGKTLG